MGEDDSLWKWSNFRLSRALDLDLGLGHTACGHASLGRWPLPIYQISLKSNKDLWTDGHLRPTLLGRLTGVDLKRNMRKYNKTSRHAALRRDCPPVRPPSWRDIAILPSRRRTSPLFPPAAGLCSSSINLDIFWVHKMSLVMRMTCRSAVVHSTTPHHHVALTVSSDMQLALDLLVVPMIRLQK